MTNAKQPGWQQPPEQPAPQPCHHIGLAFARLSLGVHPEGHTWVCGCGQEFVVVSNGGKDKRLVKRNA